jgi:hypothetical protein
MSATRKSLQIIRILGILLVGSILLCVVSLIPEAVQKHKVSQGRDAAIAQLLEADAEAFDLILVVREASTYTAYRKTCVYGDGLIVLGTYLPVQDALEKYTEDVLQPLGWTLERESSAISRLFIRGSFESSGIYSGEPPWNIEDQEAYLQTREHYPVILFIQLTFSSPQREGC